MNLPFLVPLADAVRTTQSFSFDFSEVDLQDTSYLTLVTESIWLLGKFISTWIAQNDGRSLHPCLYSHRERAVQNCLFQVLWQDWLVLKASNCNRCVWKGTLVSGRLALIHCMLYLFNLGATSVGFTLPFISSCYGGNGSLKASLRSKCVGDTCWKEPYWKHWLTRLGAAAEGTASSWPFLCLFKQRVTACRVVSFLEGSLSRNCLLFEYSALLVGLE
jgi:hypothetical protein